MNDPDPLAAARACRLCAEHLPLGPRPLLQGSRAARVLVIGQAPGRAAHESGVPWRDRSGERLRGWLGISPETFYDPAAIALLPMGFCYPGPGRGGDLPPRPECAPAWHAPLLAEFVGVVLTVYVGSYATRAYLANDYPTLSQAAAAWRELLPERIALPHPSGRNGAWFKGRPWFAADVLPTLRARVAEALT